MWLQGLITDCTTPSEKVNIKLINWFRTNSILNNQIIQFNIWMEGMLAKVQIILVYILYTTLHVHVWGMQKILILTFIII